MANYGLTSDQVAFFRENGYLLIGPILNEAEIEALRARFDWIASGEAPHVPESCRQVEPRVTKGETAAENYLLSLRKMSHVAWHDEVMLAHARRPQIVEKIAALLGDDLKLFQDQLFMKPPRIGSRQGYHQDQPLGFTIDPPDLMVTCWTALDDVTIENGCLRVIPGTHRNGVLPRELWLDYEQQAVEGRLAEEVPLVMRAGECSFHHGHLLHSSTPNLTDTRRRGYATHYVSARCRYTGSDASATFPLVRGQSHAGCLE